MSGYRVIVTRDGESWLADAPYTYRTGDAELDEAAAQVRAERLRLAAAERALVERTARLAGEIITQHGLSVRDAAELLKVSPQRISQVTAKSAGALGSRQRPGSRKVAS